MPETSASRSPSPEMAAAMSRHPASRGRATVTPLFGADGPGGRPAAAVPGPASFAAVVAVLTGPWRVDDPVGFAGAMRAAPLVAGHPVVDLGACTGRPPSGLDPLSAALAAHLETAVAAAAGRSGLAVRWVAARAGADLLVEAAALAEADDEGPELLVLAHLVEPLAGAVVADDSWVVAVVGDGRGGVAGVARSLLDRSAADGRGPIRLRLTALRNRLAGPARAAEGFGPQACEPAREGVVLPFRR
ncbi:MAG TPA: hypothetical protein VKX24_03070 [Acidimicrobiia bacterium]|nr:hypothetical protein [Acidimicrobiia bacterium]